MRCAPWDTPGHCHGDMVLFRVLCAVRTLFWSHWWFRCTIIFVQIFAHRASNCLKHNFLFVVKCWNAQKSTHPVWQTCKVLCPWELFRETMVLASLLTAPSFTPRLIFAMTEKTYSNHWWKYLLRYSVECSAHSYNNRLVPYFFD